MRESEIHNLNMSGREISLFMVKPDAVIAGDDIIARKLINECGLVIVRENMVTLSSEQVKKIYRHRINDKFETLLLYLSTGPSMVFCVEGIKAVDNLLIIKREIRRNLNYEGLYNGFHCSDSIKDAKLEMEVLNIRGLIE